MNKEFIKWLAVIITTQIINSTTHALMGTTTTTGNAAMKEWLSGSQFWFGQVLSCYAVCFSPCSSLESEEGEEECIEEDSYQQIPMTHTTVKLTKENVSSLLINKTLHLEGSQTPLELTQHRRLTHILHFHMEWGLWLIRRNQGLRLELPCILAKIPP